MATLVVAPEARADLRRLGLDHGRARALGTLERIKRGFILLGHHRLSGRARDIDLGPGRRSLPSGGYVIVHRPTAQAARIFRVVDGRRDHPLIFRP